MQKCHWLTDNFMSGFQNKRVISSSFHCLLAKPHPHLQLPLAPWHLWAHSVLVTDSNQTVYYCPALGRFRNLIWFPRICSTALRSKVGMQVGAHASGFINRPNHWWLWYMSVIELLACHFRKPDPCLGSHRWFWPFGGSCAHLTILSNTLAPPNSNGKIAFCFTTSSFYSDLFPLFFVVSQIIIINLKSWFFFSHSNSTV